MERLFKNLAAEEEDLEEEEEEEEELEAPKRIFGCCCFPSTIVFFFLFDDDDEGNCFEFFVLAPRFLPSLLTLTLTLASVFLLFFDERIAEVLTLVLVAARIADCFSRVEAVEAVEDVLFFVMLLCLFGVTVAVVAVLLGGDFDFAVFLAAGETTSKSFSLLALSLLSSQSLSLSTSSKIMSSASFFAFTFALVVVFVVALPLPLLLLELEWESRELVELVEFAAALFVLE